MRSSLKNIFIVTHYITYGAPFALRDYLIKKKAPLIILIAHPLQIGEDKSYIQVFRDGIEVQKKYIPIRFNINILNYLLEFFINLFYIFKFRHETNVYVGVDNLNALPGVIAKKTKLITDLIFYTIDYVPNRYTNKQFNNLYHHFDKIAMDNSDEVWNVSPRIAEGREKFRNLSQEKYSNQKVVPIGIWYDDVKRLPFNEINKSQLLFVGHLIEKQGVQLVIDSIPQILNNIPEFHFKIVGGGEYKDTLEKKVKILDLVKHVTFTGWVKERKELDLIMADSALAIAPYNKKLDTFTYYADPTKLKDYLSASLPIVLTDVPFNAKEIENKHCGIIIEYSPESISKAIVKILSDEKMLNDYRKNAKDYAKSLDWEKIFDMQKILIA